MKRFKYLIPGCVIAMSALASCSGAEKTEAPDEIYFTDNIKVYPADAFVVDTLAGGIVIDEVVGGTWLAVGNGVIAVATPRDETMVKLYTTGGDSIGAFCTKGQGPNDFYNADLMRPYLSESGDTCIWINDVSMTKFKRLNLSKSFREGMTLVDSVVNTEFGAINAFMAGDMLLYEVMDNDAYKLCSRSIADESDTLRSEQMYVYPTADFYAYYGNSDVSSDGRHIAVGMAYFNQLNMIDLPDMKRTAVSIGNLGKYEDCYDSANRESKFYAYGDVSCGNDEVYAIYYGRSADESDEETKGTTIHVIGYDGKVKRVLAVPEILRSISYDDSTSTLYGIDSEERVYKYDIK
ncbi:MAG: hypothetical protein K2M11_10060 [Paramuribaculum sp.]|nr:hypothetical protein [Paramuribaculum sp.]